MTGFSASPDDSALLDSWPEEAFPLRVVQEFVASYFASCEASCAKPIQVYASYTTAPDQRLTARFAVDGNEVGYKENRLPLFAASARAHALVFEVSPPGAVPHVLTWQEEKGISRLLYKPFAGRSVEDSGPAALIETARAIARTQKAVADSGRVVTADLPRFRAEDAVSAFDSVCSHITEHSRVWKSDTDGILSKRLGFSATEVPDVLETMWPQVECCVEVVAALELPCTINHNDLHTGNAFVQPDDTVLIYDWEMATLGCPLFSLDKLLVSAWRQDAGLGPGGPWGYLPETPTQVLLRDAYFNEWGRPDIAPEVFAAAMALACVQEMVTEISWANMIGWPDGNPEWTAQLIRRMRHHLRLA